MCEVSTTVQLPKAGLGCLIGIQVLLVILDYVDTPVHTSPALLFGR